MRKVGYKPTFIDNIPSTIPSLIFIPGTTMSNNKLPTFDELPNFHQYTGCAWDVWGKDDELGTVNLLTEEVVAEGAKEIKFVHSLYLMLILLRRCLTNILGRAK